MANYSDVPSIAVLEAELRRCEARALELRERIAAAKGQRPFCWDGQVVTGIDHEQRWAWNPDPHNGGCPMKAGMLLRLRLANGQTVTAHSGDPTSPRLYMNILAAFYEQTGASLHEAIGITHDDGGTNVVGW